MNSTPFRRAIAFIVVVALGWSSPAFAQPREADTHFKHGVELYKDNDYAAALVEFRRAYELDPRFQVLYNIAEAYYQLQDYANALRTFQKYLNEGGSKLTTARRAEVEHELDKLRKRVARLEISTSEPGVAISIDDVNVGTTPLEEALLVSAGRRKVTAAKPGASPVTQMVELAGGDTRAIKITMSANAAQRIEVIVPGPQAQPSTIPIVPWVITGGFAAGATLTGILALGASSDLKGKLNQFPGNADAISSARSKTAALALVTDVFIASTAISGGLAAYLTYKRSKAAGDAKTTSPAARLVVGPGSASVVGSF